MGGGEGEAREQARLECRCVWAFVVVYGGCRGGLANFSEGFAVHAGRGPEGANKIKLAWILQMIDNSARFHILLLHFGAAKLECIHGYQSQTASGKMMRSATYMYERPSRVIGGRAC